jgi:hypothetical protein
VVISDAFVEAEGGIAGVLKDEAIRLPLRATA